jgi:hypothetical protein
MKLILTKEGEKILKRLNKDLDSKCKEEDKEGRHLDYGKWLCSLEGKDKLTWRAHSWGYINEESISLDRLCWKHTLKEFENMNMDDSKKQVCEFILNNILTIK